MNGQRLGFVHPMVIVDNKILDVPGHHADNMMDFLPSLLINELDHGRVFWKATSSMMKSTIRARDVFFLTSKSSSNDVSESPEVPPPPVGVVPPASDVIPAVGSFGTPSVPPNGSFPPPLDGSFNPVDPIVPVAPVFVVAFLAMVTLRFSWINKRYQDWLISYVLNGFLSFLIKSNSRLNN